MDRTRVVSADAPSLDCAYKIQEYAGTPRRKRSEGKATWPGRKQVFRRSEADGGIRNDLNALFDEQAEGRALLTCAMRGGQRAASSPTLEMLRDYAASELAKLPAEMRDPFGHSEYPVEISAALQALAKQVDRAFAGRPCVPPR